MSGSVAQGECTASMEDLAIIEAYQARKHATCFRLLHDRYASKIYSKAITMLRDEDEAEDATQEIFTKVFLNLHKFQGQSQFSTWVYSVTYNFCIDRIRKRKRSRDLFADEVENPPDTVEEIPDEALLHMQVNELRYVLNELPDGDRTLLLMKYKEGVKIKDIATLTGRNESAIKMQLKRAKERAKRIHQKKFSSSTIEYR